MGHVVLAIAGAIVGSATPCRDAVPVGVLLDELRQIILPENPT